MCLQAYDFVELHRRYGCALQMGGSDQWGNIVNGVELGRRLGPPQLYALTAPLITTASGAKMGKTAAGAVWLDAAMLCPYDYWQFWRNTEDADVGRFLRLFTLLPLDEIARLEKLEGAEINEAKKALATEATALLHGAEAAVAPRRPRARPSRRASSPKACRRSMCRARNSTPGSAPLALSSAPAWSPRPAKRGDRSAAAACRVNDQALTDETARSSGATSLQPGRRGQTVARAQEARAARGRCRAVGRACGSPSRFP